MRALHSESNCCSGNSSSGPVALELKWEWESLRGLLKTDGGPTQSFRFRSGWGLRFCISVWPWCLLDREAIWDPLPQISFSTLPPLSEGLLGVSLRTSVSPNRQQSQPSNFQVRENMDIQVHVLYGDKSLTKVNLYHQTIHLLYWTGINGGRSSR
jgi:hypothetical protein